MISKGARGSGQASANGDSTVTKINTDVLSAHSKISQLEAKLRDTNSKLNALQASLNANQKESYLKVLVPVLNIRTTPTTANSNVIAKAEQGAYLRKIATTGKDKRWVRVEFLIDNYPYVGFVINDAEFIKEEIYDAMTFNRLYNRKLIRYQWETEAAMELKVIKAKTLGVYIRGEDQSRNNRFLGYLSKQMRAHKIYIKPISAFTTGQATKYCRQYNVQAILDIEMKEAVEQTDGNMDIRLFDQSNVILYSAYVPIQAIDLPKDLGRR